MQPIHSIFLLGLLLLHSGFGSELAESASVSFRVFPWNVKTDDLYVLNGGSYESLTAIPNNISHQFDYHGSAPMRLYRRVPAPAGQTGDVYEIACEVPVSEGQKACLLFVLRSGDGSPHGLLYPFDITQCAGNSFVLFNFTNEPIQVKAGNALVSVDPKRFHLFDPDQIEPNKEGGFRCKIAFAEDGNWQLAYNKMQHLIPQGRMLLFVSKNSENGTPQIKLVRDFIISEAVREQQGNIDWTHPVE